MYQILFGTFILCFIIERLFTGWKLPKVQTWPSRVLFINLIQMGIVIAAGYSWERWLSSASVFQLSTSLHPWIAGFIAYFIATFVFYWWHLLRHKSDFFWRYFHQIHHSPQRLEVITSFYKHPLEMVVNSILGSLIVYTFLGLSIEAGAIYTLFTALGEFFYHTNIKTPHWVGYIFQRPEMHRIHHQYNRHKNNYGDFVIWDMLFGTYENPKTWNYKCGFDEEKELRLKDMLLFRDVHLKLIPLVLLICLGLPSNQAKASTPEICIVAEKTVQQGDLIFTAIPVYPFRKVAETTNSWASHVGIVFKDQNEQWIVSESKVPLSKDTPLCDFIKNSADLRFEVIRFYRPLNTNEIETMRRTALNLLNKWYTLGFDFNSKKLFCSKFTYLIYKSVDIEVGELQTFRQLLEITPTAPITFWRTWFLGFIPWERQTISPASQLNDKKFISVLANKT